IAAKALVACDVDLGDARLRVEEIIGHGSEPPSSHIPFTPRAKKVLELSLREALQLGHDYIGTEHILLGLVREGEGVGAQVVRGLGVDSSRLRLAVMQLLSGYWGEVEEARRTGRATRLQVERRHVVPEPVCAFCERDLYEVERAVTNGAGTLLCKDCAWLAVQTMERAEPASAPVQPLVFPVRVFGDAP